MKSMVKSTKRIDSFGEFNGIGCFKKSINIRYETNLNHYDKCERKGLKRNL